MNLSEIINKRIDLLLRWQQKEVLWDERLRKDLSSQLDAWKTVKEEVEFLNLSSDEKQAMRINWLASCRKANGDCNPVIKTIKMRDEIIKALPYIKAINNHEVLLSLETLCNKELSIVDSTMIRNIKDHITYTEVEDAFKSYFEKVASFKTSMFKECYERIEILYFELKTLAQIT